MRILSLALLAAMTLGIAPARAQTFGTFTGAEPLAVNGRMFGVYLQSSQDVVALLSQLRLSFYPDLDFGFQGGLTREDFGTNDHRTTIRVGGDLKFVVAKPSTDWPFSMAVDVGLGIETGDNFTVLTVGPKVVGSRTLGSGQSVAFTPFVSAGLMFSNIDVGSNSSTDLSFPVHLGSTLRISPQIDLTGELQLRIADSFNDDVGFSFGVNLPF